MNRIIVAAMLLLLASPVFGQDGQAQQPGGQGVAPNQVIIFEYPNFISPCGSYTLTEGRVTSCQVV